MLSDDQGSDISQEVYILCKYVNIIFWIVVSGSVFCTSDSHDLWLDIVWVNEEMTRCVSSF